MSDDRSGEESVWTGFNWTRERYEELIARVTPGYHEQGGLIADLLKPVAARWRQGPFRILDLGTGTGSLSRSLLSAFPEAEVTALDVSAVMLAECRQVLASFGARAQVVEGDFSKQELGSGYRAVVSRLAIHHLRDVEKRALYRRVCRSGSWVTTTTRLPNASATTVSRRRGSSKCARCGSTRISLSSPR